MRCSFLGYDKVKIHKTVYNPAYYSDEQMLEWGREAMRGAKESGKIGNEQRFFEGQAMVCGFRDISTLKLGR